MRPIALVILGVFLAGTLASGQEFWEKKDFQTWSEANCRKLLQDSPWSRTYTIGTVLIESIETQAAIPGRESQPKLEYVVQIRSALPVRQALVRRAQIESKYEKMSEAQRQEFDAQTARLLAASYPDTVIVHVVYQSSVQAYTRDLAQYWQILTTETVRNNIFLIGSKGKKAVPIRYTNAPRGALEFELIFPRQIEGSPLIGAGDKSLGLEFPHPAIGILPAQRVYVEFKPQKMKVGGELVY